MKKVKWIALLCALLLVLGGCDWILPSYKQLAEETYWDEAKYHSQFRSNMQYQQLSDAEQACYGQLYTAVYDSLSKHSTITDINGTERPGIRIALRNAQMTRAQMSRLFEAFFRDNPQFIHLDRTYSLEGQESNGEELYNAFILQYTMDSEQRVNAIKELENAITDIVSRCPDTDDDYLIELYLHDTLVALCEYDDDAAAASSSEYANAYSAYGALIENKAVCEGYAKAMQLLLNAVSIPATVVLGYAVEDSEAHMWNLVHINGADYYLDPTWNDSDSLPQYTYFNMTSDMLKLTHTIEPGQCIPAECTDTADNYFVRNGTYINTYEREVIAQAIANRIKSGETVIHMQFESGKYENGLLFLKNLNLTRKMVNNHLNGASMWQYELRTHPRQNVIILHRTESK